MKYISVLIFIFLCGCSSSPEENKPMLEVTCKYWLQQCHHKARERCRKGHTVSRTIRMDKVGGPQGSYKEFRMLFTCD
jgi:hypothetical protein